MSTGNITINEPNFTSDVFISNAYNPTNSNMDNNNTINESSAQKPQNSSFSSPVQSLNFTESVDTELESYNNILIDVISLPIDQPRAVTPQTTDCIDETMIIPDLTTASTNFVRSDFLSICNSEPNLPEVGSNNNMDLDETTGLFIAGPAEVDTRIQSNNFILDDQTGEIIFASEIIEDESQEDIYENRKDRQFNKSQRVTGKKYMGRKSEKNRDDDKQVLNFVERQKREMRPKPCTHELDVAITPRTFLCAAVNEEQRRTVFDYFWSLKTWEAKKAYLKNLVRIRPVLRRRNTSTSKSNPKKQCRFDCLLPNDKSDLVRVCKSFLLKTLDINNQTLTEWIKAISDDTEILNEKPTKNTRSTSENVASTSGRSVSAKEWLDLLPKVPSHYCRSSSTRVYVENLFRSKTHMFKEYKKWCEANDKVIANRKLFCVILKREKISIYKPRKDQCDTCTAFKSGNIDQDTYQKHIQMKEEAYRAKEEALSLCSSEVLVLTMDVQSILLAPKLLVSEIYYKQKLQVHNLTMYTNNNKDVHLYVWHEGDGGVTANHFTSCLIDFIDSKIEEGFKKIILISDGCCYQNRNKILSSALLNISKYKAVEIEQRILEKGHTMMQVDSVHSTLENLFNPPINAPSDYVNLMAQARPSNPYVIHYLDYTFFKDYELVCELDSIRPGKKSGDPVVTDIRGLLYKNGDFFYKLRHPDEWQLLPQRIRANNVQISSLYDAPRKLDKSKFNSLQSLKKYIHRDYHAFYDNLLHD